MNMEKRRFEILIKTFMKKDRILKPMREKWISFKWFVIVIHHHHHRIVCSLQSFVFQNVSNGKSHSIRHHCRLRKQKELERVIGSQELLLLLLFIFQPEKDNAKVHWLNFNNAFRIWNVGKIGAGKEMKVGKQVIYVLRVTCTYICSVRFKMTKTMFQQWDLNWCRETMNENEEWSSTNCFWRLEKKILWKSSKSQFSMYLCSHSSFHIQFLVANAEQSTWGDI